MAQKIDFRTLDAEALRKSFDFGLSKTLGFKFSQAFENGLEAKVLVSEEHARSGGIANGGLALALLESIGSISAYCQIDSKTTNVFGTTASISHIRAAKIGDTLKARSKAVHIGRSTQIWDVEISNENGQVTSSGRITMLAIPRS